MTMEDEDGMESFEINDTDLDYALNPGRRHNQSKNQATYGIWADREDSDEDEQPSSSRSKGGRQPKNYSAGVSFVSGGIKQGNKVEPVHGSKLVKEDDVDNSPFDLRPPPRKRKQEAGANVMAGMRTSAVKGTVDSSKFADWAKFGKGDVVAKMMAKMGYKMGEGLGSDGKGIVEPVMVKPRAGRGAVGAYGKESVGPKFGESAADAQKRVQNEYGDDRADDVRASRAPPPAKGGWKKSGVTKTRYKTIEEVIEEGGSFGQRAAKSGVKVIDMTGPEQRVYSGYDSFSMKTKVDVEDGDRETFDVPELRHNLNLLLDLTEENIRRNDSQLRTLKDQTTAMEYDLTQIRVVLTREEKEADRMRQVFDLIEQFSKRKGQDAPSINDCQALFLKLRSDFIEEYRIFNLEAVAIPCVLPQIQEFFSKWRPLDAEHLVYGIDLMKEWREILVDSKDKALFASNITSFEQLSAFDRLLWEGWIPPLRRAALQWDPRDQMEAMLRIIESWLPLLPNWMKENVLEQVLIPRISDRVSSWDPLTDSVPIHSWLVPWLAILGDRLQPVLTPIRQKLAKALRMWNPTDASAMAILKPWRNVWAPATMAAFLAQNVVPKLERCLDTMNLDPRVNVKYEEWKAVVSWMDMINPDTIANVITKYFFPRWYEVLCVWLDSPNADIKEVKRWYFEWQTRVPTVLSDFPTIKENLRRALIAIGQSESGMRVSVAPPPPPVSQAPPPPPPPVRDTRAPAQSLSLKDVIEMTAGRLGLTYVPQSGRQKDGRQVFWFGPVSIYLDRGMVFAMDTQEFCWKAVSMDELLRLAGAS